MRTTVWTGQATAELVAGFGALTNSYYSGEPINDRRVVEWRHLDNPLGSSTAVELVDGDVHVGRMWIQHQGWSVGSAHVTAANPIDFLILEDHRKLPQFLSLFKSTMKTAHEAADFVIHSSNPVTDDLYRKLMKYEPCTELDGGVVPIQPFAALGAMGRSSLGPLGRLADALARMSWRVAGRLSRWTGVRLVDAPPSADVQDELIARHTAENEICGVRSAEYRAWRYRSVGPIQYQTQWIMVRGTPRGYVVFWDRDVDGVRGRFVIDFVCPGSHAGGIARRVWASLAASASRQGRHGVFFFYNHANSRLRSISTFPLVTVGRERLPQRIPVFIRPSESLQRRVVGPLDWSAGYYTLADFDMF